MKIIITAFIIGIVAIVAFKVDLSSFTETKYQKALKLEKQNKMNEANKLFREACDEKDYEACEKYGINLYVKAKEQHTYLLTKSINGFQNKEEAIILKNKMTRLANEAKSYLDKACKNGMQFSCDTLDRSF